MSEQLSSNTNQDLDGNATNLSGLQLMPDPDEIKRPNDFESGSSANEQIEVTSSTEKPLAVDNGLSTLLISAILGGVIGFSSSYFFFSHKIADIESELSLRPPVAVVDFVDIASHYPSGTTKSEAEQLMVKTQKAVVKLSNAGYLIIDRSHLISAPRDLFLPPETIINDNLQYDGTNSNKSN